MSGVTRVVAELGEGTIVRIEARGHVWNADEPAEKRGTDQGPNPYELLLGALQMDLRGLDRLAEVTCLLEQELTLDRLAGPLRLGDQHVGDIGCKLRFAGSDRHRQHPLVGAAQLDHAAQSLDDLDIALIGVPTDLGVTNRPDARHGPREIRNASSLMRAINVSTGIQPYELARIADAGDVPIENLFNLDEAIKDILGKVDVSVEKAT